jgi:hypothetical protein
MGRLAFVRQTAPAVLAQPAVRYCLVDYACPARCGDWLAAEFPAATASGRAVVARVAGQSLFNKGAANNLGARRAVSEGADYLCFLDADTVVGPGFWPWVLGNLDERRFLIAARLADGSDRPSLTGVLVVHAARFAEVQGFDETYRGWGGEDIDVRVRLRLLLGIEHGDIPVEMVEAIPHENDLRTRFYREKNAVVSNYCNLRRLKYRIWNDWRDRWKVDPDTMERLWYRPWPLP